MGMMTEAIRMHWIEIAIEIEIVVEVVAEAARGKTRMGIKIP